MQTQERIRRIIENLYVKKVNHKQRNYLFGPDPPFIYFKIHKEPETWKVPHDTPGEAD